MLGLERPRNVKQRIVLEVVEHDDVGSGGDGFASGLERRDLDLNPERKAGYGPGGGDSLRDGAWWRRIIRASQQTPRSVKRAGRNSPLAQM
jgi:hypothetical protein